MIPSSVWHSYQLSLSFCEKTEATSKSTKTEILHFLGVFLQLHFINFREEILTINADQISLKSFHLIIYENINHNTFS